MNIEKLKSGSYRIREMIDGHRYSLTVDHRPTIREAKKLLSEIEKKPAVKMSLLEAANAYIDARRNIVSPSTIRGYVKLARCIPERFQSMKITAMTSADVQAFANEYAAGRSPKTIRNMMAFVGAVLKEHDIMLRPPTLPQKEAKELYIPTAEDVRKILDYFRGSDFDVPITLMCLGLRRSEVAALTPSDLNGNILTINKATVQSESGEYITKATKTTASTRQIVIPDHIAELIRKQGYVYNLYISRIYYALRKAQNDLGIPAFPAHKLRHFYASYMHDLGYTEAQIAELGGWRDGSRVMRQVYRHAMRTEEAAQSMADDIGRLSDFATDCPRKKGKPHG